MSRKFTREKVGWPTLVWTAIVVVLLIVALLSVFGCTYVYVYDNEVRLETNDVLEGSPVQRGKLDKSDH